MPGGYVAQVFLAYVQQADIMSVVEHPAELDVVVVVLVSLIERSSCCTVSIFYARVSVGVNGSFKLGLCS